MKSLNKNTYRRAFIIGSLFVAPAIGPAAFADVNLEQLETKERENTYTTVNGKTVDVHTIGQTDHEGNARVRRNYTVSDADGNVLSQGTKGWLKTEDGAVRRGVTREYQNAAGETVQTNKRWRKNASGDVHTVRQGRRLDSNGQVTAKARKRTSRRG